MDQVGNAWRMVSRTLKYKRNGGLYVDVRGVLTTGGAEQLVGALDDYDKSATFRYSDLETATSSTDWGKFDKIKDGTRFYNVAEISVMYEGDTESWVRVGVAG